MATFSQNPSGAEGSPSTTTRGSGNNLKHEAKTLAGKAQSEGRAKVDEARGTAADKVDTLADSARAAASELKGDDIGHLSDYVSELAQNLGKLSSNMREKTGDDLLHEVSRLARDNPALFVTGSIAIGFGLSRFAKASAPTSSRADANVPQPSPGIAEGTSGNAASMRATGAGATPPYGAQTATRTSMQSGNATGNAGHQQSGVHQ